MHAYHTMHYITLYIYICVLNYIPPHIPVYLHYFTLNCMLAQYIYIYIYMRIHRERERGQPPLGARAFGFGQRSSCAKPGMRFATVPGRFDRDVELENIWQESLGIQQNSTHTYIYIYRYIYIFMLIYVQNIMRGKKTNK